MPTRFFGDKVVAATFVMAVFGWGIGFYGPPIFLYAVMQKTGWSQALCSSAVTLHFLAGTLVVVNLPRLYRLIGLPLTTVCGVITLSVGVFAWSAATQPYQLFLAATLSGFGWVALGAAAVNAVIAPWFVSKRPGALAKAYNGASIGGVIFSSVWVYLIGSVGFANAAIGVGIVSVVVISVMCFTVFNVQPRQIGQLPDGAAGVPIEAAQAATTPVFTLKRNRQFISLAAAMSLGLFAQIGLVSQLFLLLSRHVTEHTAGLALGAATASAIVGRSVATRLIARAINRRTVACLSYGCQLAGCVSLTGLGASPALLWLGMVLFGMGIGNATSLPPLIAQAEFPCQQVQRVVTLIVAIAQGCYAFAPMVFGGVGSVMNPGSGDWMLLAVAACTQLMAIAVLLCGGARMQRCAAGTSTRS